MSGENPFLHLDARQLEVFGQWINDHWTWDSDDPTSRKMRQFIHEAQSNVATPPYHSVEDLMAEVLRIEQISRGNGNKEVTDSIRFIGIHLAQHGENLLGEQVVSLQRLLEKSGIEL